MNREIRSIVSWSRRDAKERLAAMPQVEDVEIGPFPPLRASSRDGGVLVPKFAGDVHYDAENETFNWPAKVCKNPNCAGEAGRPVVFVRALPDITLDASGRPVLPVWSDEENWELRPICPVCNQDRWIAKYDPPEVAKRRAKLRAELDATRRARIESKQSGKPLPDGLRTPNEIMHDLANLPNLYMPGK